MFELSVEASGSRNTGGKYFPITGQYGVTPVVVSGKIVTRAVPFAQPLPVRTVQVRIRCVESTLSETALWEKHKTIHSTSRGDKELRDDWQKPFSISIPPSAAHSAPSTQTFKHYRVYWRFDVILEHEPIPFVGNKITKSFHLQVYDHRDPALPPISPRPPQLENRAWTAPRGAFGPGDSMSCQFPYDNIKKASITLERTLTTRDGETVKFVAASISGSSPTLRLEIPKRGAKWDVGETMSTKSTTVTFSLRARITLQGEKAIQLSPSPIHITSTRQADRLPAPRMRIRKSARRGLYMQEGTTDISDPAVGIAAPVTFILPRVPLTPILQSQPTTEHVTFPEESDSILRRYQQTGRRISNTNSEEEELQPLRTRFRLRDPSFSKSEYVRLPSPPDSTDDSMPTPESKYGSAMMTRSSSAPSSSPSKLKATSKSKSQPDNDQRPLTPASICGSTSFVQ